MLKKIEINVETLLDENGNVVPYRVIWNDGRSWKIDALISRQTSRTNEFLGVRYTVMLAGKEKNIYRIGSQWYVFTAAPAIPLN